MSTYRRIIMMVFLASLAGLPTLVQASEDNALLLEKQKATHTWFKQLDDESMAKYQDLLSKYIASYKAKDTKTAKALLDKMPNEEARFGARIAAGEVKIDYEQTNKAYTNAPEKEPMTVFKESFKNLDQIIQDYLAAYEEKDEALMKKLEKKMSKEQISLAHSITRTLAKDSQDALTKEPLFKSK